MRGSCKKKEEKEQEEQQQQKGGAEQTADRARQRVRLLAWLWHGTRSARGPRLLLLLLIIIIIASRRGHARLAWLEAHAPHLLLPFLLLSVPFFLVAHPPALCISQIVQCMDASSDYNYISELAKAHVRYALATVFRSSQEQSCTIRKAFAGVAN